MPNMKSGLVGNKLLILKILKIIKRAIKYSAFYFVYNIPCARNLTIYIVGWEAFFTPDLSKGISEYYIYKIYYT